MLKNYSKKRKMIKWQNEKITKQGNLGNLMDKTRNLMNY